MKVSLAEIDIISELLKISEEFFGTSEDSEQIPATREAMEKNILLHPKSFIYRTNNEGKLIGWVVVVPTSKELAEKFLSSEINEKELFDQTSFCEEYEALYLCAAFIFPEYRRMNHAFEMFREAIENIPCVPNPLLLAWPITFEGEKFVQRFQQFVGREIKLRL